MRFTGEGKSKSDASEKDVHVDIKGAGFPSLSAFDPTRSNSLGVIYFR